VSDEALHRMLAELAAVDASLRYRGASNVQDGERCALEKRRTALREQVHHSLLMQYDALERAGRRPALAEIHGEACGQCHLMLPLGLLGEIRTDGHLRSCPHCKRLLYVHRPS
jgi:predicted  nucleic acid-binding Zn-ribbon protein